MDDGAYFSSYPDLDYPVLTLNVYTGDLGLNGGVPTSVYSLATDEITQLTGGKTGVESIELKPGETADLPNGIGTVSLDDVRRASLASTSTTTRRRAGCCSSPSSCSRGLLTSLFIPRRRVWVKAIEKADGSPRSSTRGWPAATTRALDDRRRGRLADKHMTSLGACRGQMQTLGSTREHGHARRVSVSRLYVGHGASTRSPSSRSRSTWRGARRGGRTR